MCYSISYSETVNTALYSSWLNVLFRLVYTQLF